MAGTDKRIQELTRLSMHGLEYEPTAVLADALLETDRPDLGEDLALILAGRLPFPRDQRGEPFVTLYGRSLSRERALKVVFRRIHRRFEWSKYDQDDMAYALRELREIDESWRTASRSERDEDIQRAVQWLESETLDPQGPDHSTLYERSDWLLNGSMGRGAELLTEAIIDAPRSRQNKEAQLFRLVLAYDDRLPPNAVNEVWNELSPSAKRHASGIMRRVLLENGAEVEPPAKRPRTRRQPR